MRAPASEGDATDDSPGTTERRSLGPGAVLGAIRGSFAGASVALALLALWLVARVRFTPADAGAVALGLAFAGAVFGCGNAVAARLRGHWLERLVLFVAGAGAPLVVPLPGLALDATLTGNVQLIQPRADAVVSCALFFGCMGAGLATAASAYPATSWRDEVGRGGRVATHMLAWTAFPLVLFTGCMGPIAFAVVAYPFAFVYAIGFTWAKHLTRPLAAWFEPGESALDHGSTRREHERHVARHDRERRLARDAEPAQARLHLEAALDAARLALEVSRSALGPAAARWEDVRRLAGLIVEMRRDADLELLVREVPETAALRAEMRRLQGDAAGAEGLARAALAQDEHRAQVRSTAHAILALALADQGRCDEALVHVGEAASGQRLIAAALEGLEAPSLLRHVERRRDEGQAPRGEAPSLPPTPAAP